MLCPRCGTPVGERSQLCERCALLVPPKPPAEEQETAAASQDDGQPVGLELDGGVELFRILMRPTMWGVFALLIFVGASLVVNIFVPKLSDAAVLLSGGIFMLSMIGMLSWGYLVMQLFIEQPRLALVLTLLGVGVYLVVLAHPERLIKPFLLHMACIIGAVGGTLYLKKFYPTALESLRQAFIVAK